MERRLLRPVGGRPMYGHATPARAVGAPLRPPKPCWWSSNLWLRYPDQGEACLAPTAVLALKFALMGTCPYDCTSILNCYASPPRVSVQNWGTRKSERLGN